MKIALVIPRFDPHVGGAERWTWDFATRLLEHRHELHVVAVTFSDATVDSMPGIACHEVPAASGGFFRARFAFAAGAEELLRHVDLDVVHDMGHGWYGNVFMPHGGTRGGSFRQNVQCSAPWLRRYKELTWSILPRYRMFRELERRQYVTDGSRLFIALSEMVRRDMGRFHGLPSYLMRVVYNGIDTARFSPTHRVRHRARVRRSLGIHDEVMFLLVAHNFKLKGVGAAIEAAAQLARKRRDLRLVVIGRDRPGPYERQARKLGCNDVVQFVGGVADSVPFYAAADVYLHPTYYDPCSLVVLEALASGLPVITTVHNGAGELVTPGVHGFVLDDPSDVLGMVGCMDKLMDSGVRATCSRRARELADQHDLERNYREILAVYEEAARVAPLAMRKAAA